MFLNKFFGWGKKDDTEYKNMAEKWAEIEELMQNKSESSWRLAVIEADKLLDSALKRAFMRGDTMGERLRFAAHKHPKMQKAWEAHILRNDLVHESDRHLSRGEAERAVAIFKEGLKVMRAL